MNILHTLFGVPKTNDWFERRVEATRVFISAYGSHTFSKCACCGEMIIVHDMSEVYALKPRISVEDDDEEGFVLCTSCSDRYDEGMITDDMIKPVDADELAVRSVSSRTESSKNSYQ